MSARNGPSTEPRLQCDHAVVMAPAVHMQSMKTVQTIAVDREMVLEMVLEMGMGMGMEMEMEMEMEMVMVMVIEGDGDGDGVGEGERR